MFQNSVGEVTVFDQSGQQISLGTCFVYSADGKLVTNYHVIEGGYSAKIALGGKTYDVTGVLAYDKYIDLGQEASRPRERVSGTKHNGGFQKDLIWIHGMTRDTWNDAGQITWDNTWNK